ncbi:MAG: HAD family hydrolase [Bacteroidales bacterium]|jgi:Cof subfamily protein (haloacid dehalogenase superfamily)|nr:HAD family hydrolase [Bacteroidales bacterium]
MIQKTVQLVALDYDGTLAQPNSKVAEEEVLALRQLGEKQIVRVVATGRSLFSADEVMKPELPIDYLVFSSGVGVMHWKSREIIHRNDLNIELAKHLIADLHNRKLNFMVHHPVPDNHMFYYHKSDKDAPDFERRISMYKAFAQPFEKDLNFTGISQLLIIVGDVNEGLKHLSDLRAAYPELNVVRTTSPLDNNSMWIEIFPKHVSKASGIQFLADKLGFEIKNIICVGNDYNDLDMLHYAGASFVVGNAPNELKSKFHCIPANHEGGVAHLLNSL